MSPSDTINSANSSTRTNGAGAAAILSAGAGAIALAILAIAGDKSAQIKSILDFYKPTGVLSGVTTIAILIWLFSWSFLVMRWKNQTVAAGRIIAISLTLLILSLLLTFPPIADIF